MHASPCPASFFKGVAPQGELSPIFRGEVSMPCAFLKGGGPPGRMLAIFFRGKIMRPLKLSSACVSTRLDVIVKNVADGAKRSWAYG